MIVVRIDDNIVEFASEFEELTVGQLDRIAEIFESEQPETIQWLEIVSYLSGLPIESIEEWPYDDFLNMIMNMFKKIPDVDRIENFEFDGVTYNEPEKDSLTVRQTAAIETIFLNKEDNRMSKILAVIFTDSRKSKSDNLKAEEINRKADIISQLPLKSFIKHLMIYGVEFVNNIKKSIENESPSITGDSTVK